MTEGERCGLGSFLPMSCRGRAEAFARRLHNRLRTLGSQDGDDVVNPHTSESSWLASNEITNSIVTNCQPRHSGTENDLLMDLGIFDSPGSPAEELTEHELTKFITNPKDDLHHLNLDECSCLTSNCQINKRGSLDSESSDGQYFDPDPEILIQEGVEICNGTSNGLTNHVYNETTNGPSKHIAQNSNSIEEEQFDDSLTETLVDKEEAHTSEWTLNFDPNKVITSNNNVYTAIDLESFKSSIKLTEDTSSSTTAELYSSHFEIHQDFTVECPCTNTNTCEQSVTPEVQVSTLEIQDTDETDNTTTCLCNEEDSNHLKVDPEICTEKPDDLELEERTPRVRRCSSLKTGKTPPGTPGRKKIVRFADVLGLDLADVRTFLDEIPKVPISAFDDLSVADLSLSDTSSSSHINIATTSNISTKTLVPLFQQPGGEADFMDKVRNNQVCLENAVVKDSIGLCVCGTVRVRNLDFNKSVHIRYSLDQWKSFADLQATYLDNSCDGFSDKFSFTLYVHTLTVGQRLEFAVRFQCKGCQYWDNNAGTNYCFQCMPPSTNTSYAPITVPDDVTWAGAAFYYDNSVNLQTTVQEIVTQGLGGTPKNKASMSMEKISALTVLLFACLFIYIQKIIYFRSS